MGLRVSLAFTFASLRPGGIISRRGQRGKVRGGYGLRDSALQCSSPCPRGRGPATNFTNFTNSEQAIGARPAGIDRAGSPPTCLRRQAQPDPDWATHIMRGSGGRRSPARGFGGARAPPQRHAGQPMGPRVRGGDGPIWIAAACCRRNSASQRPGLPGAHSTHGPPLPRGRRPNMDCGSLLPQKQRKPASRLARRALYTWPPASACPPACEGGGRKPGAIPSRSWAGRPVA